MKDTRDVRRIPLDKCFKDKRYQRSTDSNRAFRISRGLDLNRLKIITVSERRNGKFAVIDGGHRVEALRLAGWTEVWAHVLHGLTRAEEARLFVLLDGDNMHDGSVEKVEQTKSEIVRKSSYQTFVARTEGKDVLAQEAARILEKHDFAAMHGGANVRYINSIGLIQNLCRRDVPTLDATFADFAAMVLDAKVSSSAIMAVFTIRLRGVTKGRGKTTSVPDDLVKKLRSYQVSRINSASKPEKKVNPQGVATYGGGGYGTAEAESLLSLLNVGKPYHRRWRLAPLRTGK